MSVKSDKQGRLLISFPEKLMQTLIQELRKEMEFLIKISKMKLTPSRSDGERSSHPPKADAAGLLAHGESRVATCT